MDDFDALALLDTVAGYESRYCVDLDRVFMSQDVGWNVPFFCFIHDSEVNTGTRQSTILRRTGVSNTFLDLKAALTGIEHVRTSQFFIIRQRGTWGKFQISGVGFQYILGRDQIYRPFLDMVTSFGLKHISRDDDHTMFHHRTQESHEHGEHFELCYNLRYVHRHGRLGEHPWSFRHTAIYHAKVGCNNQSRWVFLHPPSAIEESLTKVFDDPQMANTSSFTKELLLPHLILLISIESSWRQFFIEIECEIELLNDKAVFSRVGRPAKFDYNVTFRESQELQIIRQRLYTTRAILQTSLLTFGSLETFFRNTSDQGHKHVQMLEELSMVILRYRSHIVTTDRLLGVADGTMTLLLKILDYRHDENIRLNVSGTRELLVAAEQESTILRDIAKQTQQDSRSMKIVTFVVLGYLPGSLVASIYSSNIVAQDDQDYGFIPSRQVLSFVVFTLILTIATVSIVIVWDRKHFQTGRLWRRSRNAVHTP